MLLASILRITSCSITSKLILPSKSSIKGVYSGNMINEANIIDETNLRPSESGTGFLNLVTRLAFAKLRQTFSTAPILYYFNKKYYIWIKTNASSYVINRIVSQRTLESLD